MKNFVKGRWFPLTVAAIAALAIFLALFLCGFRISYSPELESSWDAVSAVAAWASVILAIAGVIASFVAIWCAIQVPKKIAEEQNKVSLFEKRYEAYSSILSLEVFAAALDQERFDEPEKASNDVAMPIEDKVALYCIHFATTLGYSPSVQKDRINTESVTQTISLIKRYEVSAMALPLLFYTNEKEADKMKQGLLKIFDPLLCFVTEVSTFTFEPDSKIDDKNRKNFIAALKQFKENYAEMFERNLMIEVR